MSKLDYKNYNPDILETIANLSNDEVFTPPKLANDILDLLPKEIWKDSKVTFLDPAVKTGIFLREIASRLIEGLADEIPDLQKRVNHILTKQVFGIGITELTTLMARRTLYCSMYANGPKSICTEFDNAEGNIVFPTTEHTWNKNGRCKYCGASEESYSREKGLESYAYSFIHDNMKEVFEDMKFDVIIGNPPYQLNDGGGSGTSAVPLYNLFIEKALELKPRYISMIIPSRWMQGGKGLNKFREVMISDKRIKKMYDFEDSQDCFKSVGIDGGVCYFLWDNNYEGKLDYHYIDRNGHHDISNRYLKTSFHDKVIRDSRQLSIIKKTISKESETFNEIVSVRNPFGFGTDLFNNQSNYSNVILSDYKREGYSKVYGFSNGKRTYRYINNDSIILSRESVDKYNIFFGKSFNSFITKHPKSIKGLAGTLCTDTFLKIGDFNSEEKMLNCLTYMETKFFRALFHYNRASFVSSRATFELIPIQDFSKPWTDEELYKKYKLTEEEIAYIEDNIDPMGDQDNLEVDPVYLSEDDYGDEEQA